jgi:phosphatidylglycerol:prolipoprotein diacylglycerol transferase
LIVGGLLLAASIAAWMAKRDGRDPDHVWGGLTWALIPGIVGARLWFVLFPSQAMVNQGFTPEWFLTHPFDLTNGPLAIWNGGLGIFGAVIGGMIGIVIYGRRNHQPLLEWIDIGAVVLPLGQAIGRWGNFINQEIYGLPTNLPWGITIPARSRTGIYTDMLQYPPDTLFHPIFLYESVWSAFTMVVLLYLWLNARHRFKKGDFLLLYLCSYSLIRFLLEYLRADLTLVAGVNVSQVIMGVVGVLALGTLIWRHRRGAPPEGFYAAEYEEAAPEVQEESDTSAA